MLILHQTSYRNSQHFKFMTLWFLRGSLISQTFNRVQFIASEGRRPIDVKLFLKYICMTFVSKYDTHVCEIIFFSIFVINF